MSPTTEEAQVIPEGGTVAAKLRAIRRLIEDVERAVEPRSPAAAAPRSAEVDPVPPVPHHAVDAAGSYISRTPGVMGGEACIRKTRIPVWLLVSLRRLGATEAELLSDYPGLHAADLNAAWAYHQDNRDEVEEAIAAQDRED